MQMTLLCLMKRVCLCLNYLSVDKNSAHMRICNHLVLWISLRAGCFIQPLFKYDSLQITDIFFLFILFSLPIAVWHKGMEDLGDF